MIRMSFANDLRLKSDAVAIAFAEEYAEKIKSELQLGALEGYLSYVDEISNTNGTPNLHLYRHPRFKEELEELLEGVLVSVSPGGFYTKIYFNWGPETITELRINE